MIKVTDGGAMMVVDSNVQLVMSDVTNSYYSKECLEHLKLITAGVFATRIVKTASVGIIGIKNHASRF